MTRLVLIVCAAASIGRSQTAEEIMAKVAENQGRAEAARSSYVYRQNVLVRMKRTNGKLAREEVRDYVVTPGPQGTKRELVGFTGKYGAHGKEFAFSDPAQQYKDMDIDANVVQNLAKNFGNDRKSRDGIGADMFPLTAGKQKSYRFTLAGRETYRDSPVFRITFEPRKDREEDDPCWAGEALIDAGEFQPVLIATHLAWGIPLLVKTVFGTNIQHMGFKVEYRKFADGLWFPVSYGGELKVRALFLYARTISMGALSSDFRKAEVQTGITFEK